MGSGLEDVVIVGAVLFGVGAIQLTLDCLPENYNSSVEEVTNLIKKCYKSFTIKY